MKSSVYSFFFCLLLASFLFSCQNGTGGDDKKSSNSDELESFEGIIELAHEGYFMPCQSNEKIKVRDKSQNAYDEFRKLGLPRLQPGYGSFKGYSKEDENGNAYIELTQLYDARMKIPEECLLEPLPFGVISTYKEKYRLQINPFDDMIRFQDNFTDSYLDYPYVDPVKEGDSHVWETALRTADSESKIKITITPGDCSKEYMPEAHFNHSIVIEVDGRTHNGCASKG